MYKKTKKEIKSLNKDEAELVLEYINLLEDRAVLEMKDMFYTSLAMSKHLNDKFEITYAHDDIKANYQVFMSNGYFKNLLSGYTLADFIDPVQISFSPVDTNSCNLTFYLNGNSLYCIPVQVKEHKYAQSKNSISDILREPVPSIMSSLNIISDNIEKRSIDYKKIYAGIDTINSNSLRIYKNITNMSLVSKIMSGHWPDKQAVDFSSIIKNVADSVTKFVPIVHVSLDVENNIFIDGNADFMTNAITNLFARISSNKSTCFVSG